ncbi:LapA family protein [Calothrix sp. UHCC 0171]|uniref:LapA family protein n=1 Tax=Calothrix sp. UHCC 0171 TaxID=3110245 RepID=UPI002B217BA8|nr:LapA family protein [Calothrix sp. UHCC 0171]MEA5571212.1 LapA family protein [Calothrix sp. UHCC 0171]
MAVIRLILLFTVMGGLTLLLVQNFSPALSLTFLGMRSQPLPLAIWILLSVVAGSITSLLVSSLYELADSLGKSSQQARAKATVASSSSRNTSSYRAATNPSSTSKSESSSNVEDDWNLEASEDWDFEQQPKANTRFQEEVRDRKVSDSRRNSQNDYAESDDERGYRRQQGENARKSSASSYSYSYREPKNSGVGKTESIYDADYRVIVPPYNPPSPEASQPTAPADSTSKINDISGDDDWSFFDEDDSDLRDEPRDSR